MAFDWGSLLGGALGLAASNRAAKQAQDIASQQAQASQFRPIGVTTRFGKSGFQYDPATGQLTGAGYQAAPDVAAMREGLLGLAGGALSQAQQAQAFQPQVTQAGQGLFNLGQQYIAQTPQQAAQNWMSQQQQLLAPGREQELARLQTSEFNRGTGGLGVGATQAGFTAGAPGLAASNPRFAAMYNAQAMQDAQLAAQAQQAGMQQAQFGQGLLTGGLGVMQGGYQTQQQAFNPFTSAFQGATNVENQALNALTQGTALGSDITAAAQKAAQAQAMGQQNAALQQQTAINAAIKGLSDPIAELLSRLD